MVDFRSAIFLCKRFQPFILNNINGTDSKPQTILGPGHVGSLGMEYQNKEANVPSGVKTGLSD